MKFLTIENKITSVINQHNKNNKFINPIGDDCIVVNNIACYRHKNMVITTEQVVSDIHYLYNKTSSVLVGRKLVKRCVSNMCAIGGAVPIYASIAITLHQNGNTRWIDGFYNGLIKECNIWNISICCGDTVLNNCINHNKQVVVSMTLIGEINNRNICSQYNAHVNELIYATGCYGNSFISKHHLNFIPRFQESVFLSSNITKAINDVSDGLLISLYNIAIKSSVTMCIDVDRIPKRDGCNAVNSVLMDGEDYELVFTVPVNKEIKLINNWPFKTKLSKIGYVNKINGFFVINIKNNKELMRPNIINKFYNKRYS